MKKLDTSHIPNLPGVYLFKDKKEQILYIGKAKNLQKRVNQYFTPGSVWKQEMLLKADHVDFFVVENESESLYLESNLIKKHLPPFNNMLKGANAYAYIKLTKHPVPQVLITRKKINDGAIYIGPKHNTRELKKFLQYLRQIIQYRTCPLQQFNKKKLCSDYYFGLCQGRCAKPELGAAEYTNIIVNFFKGNTTPVEKEIKKLIDEAVLKQNFERAAKLRDIYFQIDQFTEKQTVEFAKNITGYLLQIRPIGQKYVYVLLNFYEGKLIDIIRHHFDQEDTTIESMLNAFQSEFGDFYQHEIRYTTTKYKRTQTESVQLQNLFNNFFESYIISQTMQGSELTNDLLDTLKQRYDFPQLPYQIECLDISHLQGDQTSGGLSCLLAGIPEKKLYRKYKIKTVKNNDYLALQEVLIRRFQLGKKEKTDLHLPDIFILDGGKGQLGILEELAKEYPELKQLRSQVQFCALGKGEARSKSHIGYQSKKSDQTITEKLYLRKNNKIQSFDLVYDEADRLLTKLRDEAHRFANFYRKQQAKLEFKTAEKKATKSNKNPDNKK
ncbi:MAG: GIY-YIG nuclease family protein [candidate division SR1 bacterium]|nr:GIY-YIG nuclease family protein [candidate division SR1 bacterium]